MTDLPAAASAEATPNLAPARNLDGLSLCALVVGGGVAVAGLVALHYGQPLANVIALTGGISGACLALIQRNR